MTPPLQARRGFKLSLPEGFIELPLDDEILEAAEDFSEFTTKVSTAFDLSPNDQNSREVAISFAGLGSLAGNRGVDYASVAFYKSPDDPLRPIMIMLTGVTMPSEHHREELAITGLLELKEEEVGRDSIAELHLPVGPAVAVVNEEENALIIEQTPIPILTRQISAWVPDPDGTTIGVVTATTNCYLDWEHVCVLALEIFDSFEWEPLSEN
jgi:hypothetical protein